jgi:hypothetical protein
LYSWIVDPKNEVLATKKAEELVRIYQNMNYGSNSRVFKKTDQYREGFLAELEFCDFLSKHDIEYQYLNQELNPYGDDDGDFIV